MEAYVLEYGKTYLCDISTKQGCSERELTYLSSFQGKDSTEVATVLTRLQSILDAPGPKSKSIDWVRQRAGILKQLKQQQPESVATEL